MKGTDRTMVAKQTNQDNQPEPAETTPSAPIEAVVDNPVEVVEVVQTAEEPQTVQRNAIEIKMLKDCDLLKADAKAIMDNVDIESKLRNKVDPAINPMTVLCRNLGVLDNLDNLDNPAFEAIQDALDNSGIGINFLTLVEQVQIIANALKKPDLSKLDDKDIQAIAADLDNALKASKYLDVAEDVLTTAKFALGAFHASRTSLREWATKGTAGQTNANQAKAKVDPNEPKVDQRVKVSELLPNVDIVYHCDNPDCKGTRDGGPGIGYKGQTTIGGVYYAIRDHYVTCRGLAQGEHAGTSQTYRDIKDGVNKLLQGDNQHTVPGGYVMRESVA